MLASISCPTCKYETRPRRTLPTHVDLRSLQAIYGEALYSQDDEETLIRAFFADHRGGSFLDVGAGDPIRDSTTYYLEKHLGWHGIAVDAIAVYAGNNQTPTVGTALSVALAAKVFLDGLAVG